jgi:branched-chain amino acid transport system substrate-binding protein
MRRRKSLALLTLLAILTIVSCSIFRRTTQEGATARIGIPAPLSGGSAEYGTFMRQGAMLAADEINEAGGVSGKKLELVFEDSQGDPAEATKAAEKLIVRDQVNVVTCAFNSSATLAVADVAKRAQVPLVVGLSTADAITTSGNPYVFRVCAPNSKLASLLGDYIAQKEKPATVAYIYEKTDFGINLANVVRQRLEQSGSATVANEGINQHEVDFLSLITKLKPLKPDMVFLAMIADSALPFLRQAKQAGFRARWANAVSLSNPKFLQDAGDLADGFIGITHFEASAAQGAARAFVENFKSKYGAEPTHYAAVYYDTVRLIADAMGRGGFARDGILGALKTTKFQGITGTIQFGGSNQANIGTVIFEWKGRRKVLLQTDSGI